MYVPESLRLETFEWIIVASERSPSSCLGVGQYQPYLQMNFMALLNSNHATMLTSHGHILSSIVSDLLSKDVLHRAHQALKSTSAQCQHLRSSAALSSSHTEMALHRVCPNSCNSSGVHAPCFAQLGSLAWACPSLQCLRIWSFSTDGMLYVCVRERSLELWGIPWSSAELCNQLRVCCSAG